MIWTAAFWKGAAERAIATFFQTFVAILSVSIGGALIPAVGIEGVSWLAVLSGSAVAAILSLAKSLATPDFTAGTSPEPAQTPVTHIEHTYATDMSAEDVERLIVSLRSDKYPDTGQDH